MTKHWLTTIGCLFWAVSGALAQETPTQIPADNGPSLEVTMNFIVDKLNGIGPVNFVAINSGGSYRNSLNMTGFVADSNNCQLGYNSGNLRKKLDLKQVADPSPRNTDNPAPISKPIQRSSSWLPYRREGSSLDLL